MSSGLVQMLDLCRLCLVKDRVGVPIFEDEGDVRQVFLKIAACLPVKVSREDKLPKKICDDCMYKLELFYQFWNTTANAEKQLLQWLGEVEMEDKQGYVTGILNPDVMKQEQQQASENRLDGSVMQQVGTHQNMGMEMMDNMGLGMPIIISTSNQQMTSVPMDTSVSSVQTVQALPGPSTQSAHDQIAHDQIAQNQVTNVSGHHEEEEDSSEEEENETDDECDGDDGLPVKEEGEEDLSNRTVEPTTFVNVSLACDEAGPSGLQQQKITEMPEMTMPQVASADNKTGRRTANATKVRRKPRKEIKKTLPVISLYRKAIATSNSESRMEMNLEPDLKIEENKACTNIEPDVDQVLHTLRDTCPFCDKRFKDEKRVEKHVRAVHKRPYRCDMCRRSYFTARVLEEHRKTHSSDFFFECSICHLKYKREEGLKQHHVRVHSNVDAKFMCDHCGKRYKLKLDLLLHIGRAHMCNIQICRFCGKAVKDVKGHEWRHQKRNRKSSIDFPCHLCFKKFRSKTKLDNHLLMHKERYTCQECGLELAGPSQLMNHKLKHKPGMTCTVCEKVFISRSNFYQHVLTHAGIRPYKCDVCNEDFTQRSSLLRHRKNHPGPLPPLVTPTPIADLARNVLQKL